MMQSHCIAGAGGDARNLAGNRRLPLVDRSGAVTS